MKPLLMGFVLLLRAASLSALEPSDPNVTFAPEAPPATPLLDIPFGEDPFKLANAFTSLGEPEQSTLPTKQKGLVRLYEFNAPPPKFSVREGKTRVIFFKNKLIRVDSLFAPSYAHFLLVRERLMKILSDRFSLERKTEMIDAQLKIHLAQLEEGEFNQQTEDQITASILDRTTFFYYQIADAQGEFNILLAYHAARADDGSLYPRLLLHLSLVKEMEEFKTAMAPVPPPT